MNEHPTDLDLDLSRTGEADDEVRRHVETCAACRAKVEFFERAATDLGRLPAPIPVPPEREAAILSMARERAAEVRRKSTVDSRQSTARRGTLWRVVPWAAAASLALVVGGTIWLNRTSESEAPPPIMATAPKAFRPPGPPAAPRVARVVAAGPDDLNSDGRVDIVDAYLMARSIERGRSERAWDRNRDGRVDRGDVDRIAFAVVSLRRGGGK
jgi:hypothetical protein